MKTKHISSTLAGLATLALVPALALAAPGDSAADTGSDAGHESGLMLRYTVGGSYARTGQKFDTIGNPKYHVHGAAVDMSLAAGFALSDSVAVHGTALFWRAFNPSAKGEFGGLSGTVDTENTSLTNFGIGGGVTVWTGSNLYFSASVVASMLRVEIQDERADTKWGVGGELLVGKEWWVGDSFGIGVAAAGTIHYIPDNDLEDAKGLVGFSVGPRLTMTFN